jgi:hypothetical protein
VITGRRASVDGTRGKSVPLAVLDAASDSIFNAALLAWHMAWQKNVRVAIFLKAVMLSELNTIIEGNGET